MYNANVKDSHSIWNKSRIFTVYFPKKKKREKKITMKKYFRLYNRK